jgi:3-hydroxyacyl-[acyl-carrier-protein] dehydratase
MAKPLMSFEEVRALLKQRFPMLMVDNVISLEPGKSIRTTKNVTGNEIQFLGHFPEHAVLPGTLIVEAMGQSASILFSKSGGTSKNTETSKPTEPSKATETSKNTETSKPTETRPGEFLVLGSINDTRFLVPVVPGDKLEIDVQALKFMEDFALVEGVATVDGAVVAQGKLGFARRRLQTSQPAEQVLS